MAWFGLTEFDSPCNYLQQTRLATEKHFRCACLLFYQSSGVCITGIHK
nr:MAG TPA: hypothetical protein [Bacteriophage sp.]DAS82846.1 MAG TPA: hypothetical protein [Caudoviricetes sp.]